MREKLNENPLMQVAVLGVLALIVGFVFITRMGGGGGDSSTAAPATTATTPAPTDTTATTPGAATTPDALAIPTPSTPATPATPTTGAFKPGPGLPKDVVKAYDSGDVVVLLVVDDGGVDDQKLKPIVEDLRGRPDTSLFVVEAKNIADYSRIAQGVDLQQTPALVVLRPKKLTKGPIPTATIEYGFRGPDSVMQMVEDALYKGPTDLPYYPN